MSKPIVTERIGGYLFTWTEEQIAISVSRTHVHTSDSRVTGELLIRSSNQIVYPPTTFNFTSDRTRASLVRELVGLSNSIAWGEIINQLCLAVVDREREGEPVRELWTSEEVPPPEWLLEPLLYKGLPTIIFGEKAVCKSTLSLAIYTALTLPWHDNPLGWGVPGRPIKTLLADFEVDYDIAHYNIKQLQKGMGLPDFPLYYRRCSLPIVDDIDQIQNHINKLGAEVIIIDSLGPAVGGDLKDPKEALRFTSALRQLHCSALIVGQTSKEKEGGKNKSVFGSTFFEYYSRNIVEVRKAQEEGEDTLDIALYNTYHNLGKRFRPMGYRLVFNGSGTHINPTKITAPELIRSMGIKAQVLALLKGGPMKSGELIEAIPTTTAGTIRGDLVRLKKDGKIVQLDNGDYVLAAHD